MQVALTLQYIPPDGETPPVSISTSIDPLVLQQYRDAVLRECDQRTRSADDSVERLILESEADRLRGLLDQFVPEMDER